MATPLIVADFETQLATSLAIAGTSFSLASGTDDDGEALPAGLYYFTVDNGTSNKEYLAGTLSGTSVTAVLSVSRQGVETSGAVRAHRVGASCVLTDFATYMKYMNSIALVSAPDASTIAKGVVEAPTQAEVDAKTAVGGTGALLAVTTDKMRSTKMHDYVVDTGAANAYVITPSPAITAYSAGQIFAFKAVNANTTTSTLNVASLGAVTIKKQSSANLTGGEIIANQVITVVYDGTNMQMIGGNLKQSTVQTFAGSGTYTKPTGLVRARVQVWGAGSSGSVVWNTTSRTAAGGGGGGYSEKWFEAAELSATHTVTIGTGGAAVSLSGAGSSAGNNGVSSSFGALLTAYGGAASATPTTTGGNGGSSFATGGGAPDAGVGVITAEGTSGTTGGGGGGGATAASSTAYNGGKSIYGGGGGGGGSTSSSSGGGGASIGGGGGGAGNSLGSDNAGGGTVPSGGGGGAAANTGTVSSGPGGAGKIVVTEYYA